MPRKKITNRNKKRAELMAKRAAKRGDAPPPEPKRLVHKRNMQSRFAPVSGAVGSARKLQSAFVKLPKEYLETTKTLAATIPLTRPLPLESAVLPTFQYNPNETNDGDTEGRQQRRPPALTCPKRPSWRFDMTKKEVESNEEGHFQKWLKKTDELIEKWRNQENEQMEAEGSTPTDDELPPKEPTQMPSSWSYFERNLDVWRQLWRVTEISQIILVLLDSRCPLVHYPPSLREFLSNRKVILVLTKVDISGPERTAAWTSYLNSTFPGVRIVHVETERLPPTDQKLHHRQELRVSSAFRRELVGAIRELHEELLQPPDEVKNNEAALRKWKPSVKPVVNWDELITAEGERVGAEIHGPTPHHTEDGAEGQPNVGKSSLLNALFGRTRVSVSKTPGKTKHFQTLFWTQDVRLVDCPGLVMPNYVPMEMQVLSAILPISRMAAIAACTHYISERLPLERILHLQHPEEVAPPVEDKRTWRTGSKPTVHTERAVKWTAMEVLTGYAEAKAWVTAMAARPDVNRAGNAILRALAEGRIAWAFWPPGTSQEVLQANDADNGIWIPRSNDRDAIAGEETKHVEEHEETTDDSDELGESEEIDEDEEGEEDDEEDDDEEDESGLVAGSSRFSALSLEEASEVEGDVK
ncbi:hypothetical protein ONZ45_g13602 [Pleurotus djamor]|nr:hypothetical protein ONZ45_g13602 [Pleurotus djamor]